MKSYPFYKLLALCYLVLNAASCSKEPCDCDFIQMSSITLKFTNQQGQNLFFGSNAIYQLDSLKVLNQKDNFTIYNASVNKGQADTAAVEFNFYIIASKNYIYYNTQTPVDSVEIKWSNKTGKCCNTETIYRVIDSVKINNIPAMPVNGVITFIK